jgi:hypothetical protein
MRQITVIIFVVLFSSVAFGQDAGLPEILKPGPDGESAALRLEASAIKLLPRGMFNDAPESYRDEDNPLGIRFGGSVYSFSNESHSYNKTPQLGLDGDRFTVGFYGGGYGYIDDLGAISLKDVARDMPNVQLLMYYRPPTCMDRPRPDTRKLRKDWDGTTISNRAAVVAGHSYLLRAVSFDEADTLVAFQVINKNYDGSVIIVWTPLKEFDTPRLRPCESS